MDNNQPPNPSASASPSTPEPRVLTQTQLHKQALRKELVARRQSMPNWAWHCEMLQRVMRVWLSQVCSNPSVPGCWATISTSRT